MKSIKLFSQHRKALVIYRMALLSLAVVCCKGLYAQSGFVSAGGDFLSGQGAISASIGQTFAQFSSHTNANITEGLQQTSGSFSSCNGQWVYDSDGFRYESVQIGSQCWLKSNLRTTKYQNGQSLLSNLNDSVWATTNHGAFSNYDNHATNGLLYGNLYNWHAVNDSRGLCPTGWHVPTTLDWQTLSFTLDAFTDTNLITISSVAGKALKSTSGLWSNYPNTASNSTGFSALPGGWKVPSFGNGIADINVYGHWWSSDTTGNYPDYVYLSRYDSSFYLSQYLKNGGYSVRCLKNDSTSSPSCSTHNFQPTPGASGHYNQRFNWTAIAGASEHRLQYRMVGSGSWSGVNESGTQRLIQNLSPGNYQARVYGVGLGDTSCLVNFSIACANDVVYSTNIFQAGYLDALPASSARVTIFNVSGGKSLYNFELENLSSGSISRVEGRRNYTFNQLAGGNYVVRVYDAYNCSASVETPVVIEALDTAYIPNLISAVNSSPNGFRPIWNRPRQNGVLMPGVLSYQLRVRNETDNQLVSLLSGIADTFRHVNNLTPGKLYRFNVRSRYNPGGGARNSAFSIRRDRSLGAGGNKLEEGAEEPQEGVRVYPNPTRNVVNAESPIGSRIKLYDLQGRLLQSHQAEGQITQIDLSLYAVGTYVLKVETPNKVEQYKVVKQ